MPSPTHENLTIPRERHRQLLGIMNDAGAKTISETLGLLFKAYAAQGRITHDLPGVEINRLSDGIALKIDDNERAGLSLEGARLLAETVRRLATGESKQGVINMDHDFAVTRKGSGIRIDVPFTAKQTKTYGADLALEFAEVLEKAAQ